METLVTTDAYRKILWVKRKDQFASMVSKHTKTYKYRKKLRIVCIFMQYYSIVHKNIHFLYYLHLRSVIICCKTFFQSQKIESKRSNNNSRKKGKLILFDRFSFIFLIQSNNVLLTFVFIAVFIGFSVFVFHLNFFSPSRPEFHIFFIFVHSILFHCIFLSQFFFALSF